MFRLLLTVIFSALATSTLAAAEPLALGERRELFVDHFLIEKLSGAELRLHEPRDEGVTMKFDAPWEGGFCNYVTVIRDESRILLYYRGKPKASNDGQDEVTCVAESSDGIHWTKPKLGLFAFNGSKENNIIWAESPTAHNFSPLLDTNPAAVPAQRFKALGGTIESGLLAFVSPDGVRWEKLRQQPVLTKAAVQKALGSPYMFDSQNVAFWSPSEKKYVSYFRVAKDNIRRIARAESVDFVNWSNLQLMEYRTAEGTPAPLEHLYLNQTYPYPRAPHIYVSLAARFMPDRQVITADEAKALNMVDAHTYMKDTSDGIFQTTRGGNIYYRTFMGVFIRPGIGLSHWVSRTNYPALGVVQTGESEMSCYIVGNYAQPTAHLRRLSLRLDGFASVAASYKGGELLTKPLTFSGSQLLINFSTSAAGGIRVEIQDESGKPLPGYTLADSIELIGNEIERAVRWKSGPDVSKLAGQPIRLRFVIKDADVYALRFGTPDTRR